MEELLRAQTSKNVLLWHKVAKVSDFPENGGACVIYNGKQVAIYNFSIRGEWYATQNLCPHRYEMALSRGIIGDSSDEPKVACPFHKKNFSLKSGKCLSGDPYQIDVYPVKAENGYVFLGITNDLL